MEKKIVLAGGCFWGTEALLKKIPGVIQTTTGYANSAVQNPSYEAVCENLTQAAESVLVTYNPSILPLEKLLLIYFESIDPTSFEKQGGDIGNQYRTGIYYIDANDFPVIERIFEQIQKKYQVPLQTECLPLENFYPAEEYHQDYLEKNPTGYCHVDFSLLKKFGL